MDNNKQLQPELINEIEKPLRISFVTTHASRRQYLENYSEKKYTGQEYVFLLDADDYIGPSARVLRGLPPLSRDVSRLALTADCQDSINEALRIVNLLKRAGAKRGFGTVIEHAELKLMAAIERGLYPGAVFKAKNPIGKIAFNEIAIPVSTETFLELKGTVAILQEENVPSGTGSVLAYAQKKLAKAAAANEPAKHYIGEFDGRPLYVTPRDNFKP